MSILLEPAAPLPQVELIETDGVPLESDWHRDEINFLIAATRHHYRGRDDYFVGGNMFIYFSEEQARNRDFRGPDFFLVDGVPAAPPRDYWAVWLEGGRYPDLIIELLSPSTAETDRTVKKKIYEKTFRTFEYFCYDPETRQLEGWRLLGEAYQPLEPDQHGRLFCQHLGLFLGLWEGEYQGKAGVWLRFFDEHGNVALTFDEAADQRAGELLNRLEAERQRAEAERQRAEAERQRADAAEAELRRLRDQLNPQQVGE